MAVTHNPVGFTGTVDQTGEARRFVLGAGGYWRVDGSASWAISASSSSNRTINIAAGAAAACGVYDSTTAADAVTVAVNSSGSDRFDAIVATWDWNLGQVSFRVVQGTSSTPAFQPQNSTTVDATKINRSPGLQYDAVLAIVRVRASVTIIAPADVYDCRLYGPWRSMVIANSTYLNMAHVDSGQAKDAVTGAVYDWNGSSWQQPVPTNRLALLTGAAAVTPATGWAQGGDISFLQAVGAKLVTASFALNRTGANIVAASTGNLANTIVGTVPAAYRPIQTVPLTTGPGGSIVSGVLYTNGNVTLTACTPNYTISTGTEITLMCPLYAIP